MASTMIRRYWTLILVLGLGIALARPASGQTLGAITGLVTDRSGGAVVGATVTVTNTQTNATRTVITNGSGNYSVPDLLPGVYSVKVQMRGFSTATRLGVALRVAQVATLDFKLKVGSLTQTVEVTGGAPLLDTQDATVGTVIDNQRIVDLPLNGRNFTALIPLSPNVTASFGTSGNAVDRQGGSRTEVAQISVAGMRAEYNDYTLDGIQDTDPNFNVYTYLPSIDAIQEFKVQTGVYSAEYGYEPTQINVSTKSGTNEYHGTIFDFVRNDAFDALPFDFTSTPVTSAPFRWNQFGFNLGGPVIIPKVFNGRDKLFFMSSYQGFRQRQLAENVYSTPPEIMRNGDFSQLLPKTVITDPLAGHAPFPNNVIPTARLDPTALALLNFDPLPNVTGAGLKNNYLALDGDTDNIDQFLQRIDFTQSDKTSWFGRYNFSDESSLTPALYENGLTIDTNVRQGMISNTHILAPNMVNEFRAGYTTFYNNYGNQLQNTLNTIQQLGINAFAPPPGAGGTPNVELTSFSTFGTGVAGPWILNDKNVEAADDFSWILGRHSIKFGAEFDRPEFNEDGNQDNRGQYLISDEATGYPFSDYMLGYINQFQDAAALGIAQDVRDDQFYYAADSWKVRPDLTVDVGLRYEYVPPWSDNSGTEVNLYFPPGYPQVPMGGGSLPYTGPHPCFVRVGAGNFYANTNTRFNTAICTERNGILGSRLMPADYTDFAPRLGIAWSPTPNWVVRAGAGIFYAQDISNTVWDMNANIAAHTDDVTNPQTLNLTLKDPLGSTTGCSTSSPQFVCVNTPQGLANLSSEQATPYIEQYELNVQRQAGTNTVVELGYLGSEGHDLPGLETLNNPLVMSPTAPVGPRRAAPEFGNIQTELNALNSDYNGLSGKLTHRFSRGFTLLAGYTYSKSIDEGSDPRNLQGETGLTPPNGTCFKCIRGLSSFNATNRFVASGLYHLPFGNGRSFLTHGVASALLGGWQIGAIATAQSGFPFSVEAGVDRSNSGETHDVPNLVGQANLPSGARTTARWFNTSAFVLQPLGTQGDAGRNIVTGPGIFDVDSVTERNITIHERLHLQFRAEFFNTLNRPNFGLPQTTLTKVGFGSITSLNAMVPMREIQFGLKLIF